MRRLWRSVLLALTIAGSGGPAQLTAPISATPLPRREGAAGALPAPRAPGPALEAALSALRGASDAGVSDAMLTIALSDDPAAIDHLLLELTGPRAPQATSALAIVGGDAAAQGLLVALDHADPGVRLRAASGLRALRSPATVDALVRHLTAGRPIARETCRMMVVALARAAGPGRAVEVRRTLEHVPAACDIGAGERAAVDWILGAPGAKAALLAATSIDLDLEDLPTAPFEGTDGPRRTMARRILAGSHRADAVVRAALVLAGADDPEGRAIVHDRLVRPAVDACAVVGSGMLGGVEVLDPGACEELRALVVAAGLLRSGRDLPLLLPLATPARARSPRGEPAPRSPLTDDALYARALYGDGGGDPEITRILDEDGPAARALRRTWPRVAPAVASTVLARAPGGVPKDLDDCAILLEWEDPRRLEVARTLLRRDDVPAECRPWAGLVLAREGTDEDRRLVADVAATRIAAREEPAPGSPALAGRMPVVWARVAADLPRALHPDWTVVRSALEHSAVFLVPANEPDRFFASGSVELGALDAILRLRPAQAPPPSVALTRLVRASTAEPTVAAAALAALLLGAPDADAQGALQAMWPDIEGAREADRPARALRAARLMAAALSTGDRRARAFARECLVGSGPEVRAELARLALLDEAVPARALLGLLDDPSATAVAALALRSDASCIAGVAERLTNGNADTKAAAAVVAAAMREPALAEALGSVARSGGAAAVEATVALAILGRADAATMRRLDETEMRFGREDGIPGRIALARTLAGLAPAWGGYRGAGLWSCRWSHGVPSAVEEGRADPRGTLATAAIVLRAHPGRMASLGADQQAAAAEDLTEALGCLGGALDLDHELGELSAAASVPLRRTIARVILARAQLDPGTPLLVRLATDPDATVRERVVAAFRSAGPGGVRPFDALLMRLAADGAPATRMAAIRILPLGEYETTPIAIRALQDPAAEVRRAVLENPSLTASHVVDHVARLAEDPDPGVRIATATALADSTIHGGGPALRRLLAAEPTRSAALRSLCRRGTAADLPAVLDAFRRMSSGERQSARFSFAMARRLLGSNATAAVRRILADRDPEVARLGVVLMSMTPLAEAIGIYEAAQRHRFPAVRRELAALLGRLRMPDPRASPSSTDSLRAIARRLLQDSDPSVRCRALLSVSPGDMAQEELDELTGETGVTAAMLRDRWSCSSLSMFD